MTQPVCSILASPSSSSSSGTAPARARRLGDWYWTSCEYLSLVHLSSLWTFPYTAPCITRTSRTNAAYYYRVTTQSSSRTPSPPTSPPRTRPDVAPILTQRTFRTAGPAVSSTPKAISRRSLRSTLTSSSTLATWRKACH
jgi:hypothetical protein